MSRKNHLGKYYQKNGRFQIKRDKNSMGLCIISDYEKDIVMSLEEKMINYRDIDKESLPSYLEMITAITKFKEDLNLSFYRFYWVNSDSAYISTRSGGSDCRDSGIGDLYIRNYPDSRINYCGSRFSRKVWRIGK